MNFMRFTAQPRQADKAIATGPAGSGTPGEKKHDEEPEPSHEEDIPLDGRDEEGEAMIRDLPKPVERARS